MREARKVTHIHIRDICITGRRSFPFRIIVTQSAFPFLPRETSGVTTAGTVVPASLAPVVSARFCSFSVRISHCSNASEVRASLVAFSAVPARVCRALSFLACCSLSSLISPACCSRKACSTAAWRVSASVSLFPAVSLWIEKVGKGHVVIDNRLLQRNRIIFFKLSISAGFLRHCQ